MYQLNCSDRKLQSLMPPDYPGSCSAAGPLPDGMRPHCLKERIKTDAHWKLLEWYRA